MRKRKVKKILEEAEDLWVFKVDGALDDIKILKEKVKKLEEKIL